VFGRVLEATNSTYRSTSGCPSVAAGTTARRVGRRHGSCVAKPGSFQPHDLPQWQAMRSVKDHRHIYSSVRGTTRVS